MESKHKGLIMLAVIVLLMLNNVSQDYLPNTLEDVMLLLIIVIVSASIVDWYLGKNGRDNAGKKVIGVFWKYVQGLPTLLLGKMEKKPANYALGIVIRNKEAVHYFFATSSEAELQEIKEYRGVPCTLCQNHEELKNSEIYKLDPDGNVITEPIYTQYDKKHATCAEKKILAEFMKQYATCDLDYLILFTHLAMCESCVLTVEAYRKKQYRIKVIDQTQLLRLKEWGESNSNELGSEDMRILQETIDELQTLYPIK